MLLGLGGGAHAGCKGAVIEFQTTSFSFGRFAAERERFCVFVFVNKGDAPLVVEEVASDSRTTKANFTREPVAPGQRGYVTVVYAGRKKEKGYFKHKLEVKTNATNHTECLQIEGCMR